MSESKYWHKSHNESVLIYHLVFPAKYRKAVFTDINIDGVVKNTCLELEKRYEIVFLEIGTDIDHMHLLVQSVPTYSITQLVKMIKSITARQVFSLCPDVKKQLWGSDFWSGGYYASTVGHHGNEKMTAQYVKSQGLQEYTKLHEGTLKRDLF
jgi:putative transposase